MQNTESVLTLYPQMSTPVDIGKVIIKNELSIWFQTDLLLVVGNLKSYQLVKKKLFL